MSLCRGVSACYRALQQACSTHRQTAHVLACSTLMPCLSQLLASNAKYKPPENLHEPQLEKPGPVLGCQAVAEQTGAM